MIIRVLRRGRLWRMESFTVCVMVCLLKMNKSISVFLGFLALSIPSLVNRPLLLLLRLDFLQPLVKRAESLLDVTSLLIHDTNSHVAKSHILCRNLLVQPTRKYNTPAQQPR